MERKDHNASEKTKQEFEKLKTKYPKVFSINNEDIGCTQLVTMDIDTGDSPPVSKTIHPPPQTLQLGATGNRNAGVSWSHQKEHQPLGQSYCCCPQEVSPW